MTVWTIVSLLASMAGCFGFALCGNPAIADTIMGDGLMERSSCARTSRTTRPGRCSASRTAIATGAAIAITAAVYGSHVHRDQHAVADADHVRLRRDRASASGASTTSSSSRSAIWKADRDWPKVACSPRRRLAARTAPGQGESRQEPKKETKGEGGGAEADAEAEA
ncbi:MAG: hypothetical protein ACLTMP_07775 [Eggerthella lenta]